MDSDQINKRWLRKFGQTRLVKSSLFCFPYGGAGPSVFHDWDSGFANDVQTVGILYPGRESRTNEPLVPDIRAIAEAMVPTILPNLNKPFVFFGHSMGGLVSFELARILEHQYQLSPQHLFVSGADAPHVEETSPIHELPEQAFLDALIELNGMPEEVLASRELLEYALPIIRSDFAACANYRFDGNDQLSCPITALAGAQDPRVEAQRVDEWKRYTTATFELKMLQGDHFFLFEHKKQIQAWLSQALKRH